MVAVTVAVAPVNLLSAEAITTALCHWSATQCIFEVFGNILLWWPSDEWICSFCEGILHWIHSTFSPHAVPNRVLPSSFVSEVGNIVSLLRT